MKLYHGSRNIVDKPLHGKGKQHNDYGRGFYCTEEIELAQEWACTEECSGFVNEYELDKSDLNILNLLDGRFSVLNWIAILVMHRSFDVSMPVALNGKKYLENNFYINVEDYDIIKGYRADDSYFSFARAFLNNTITVKQLERAMQLGKLGEQIVLKSERAFEKIRFITCQSAEQEIYYFRRKKRDERARNEYVRMTGELDTQGIYLIDIIREEIKDGDARLQ